MLGGEAVADFAYALLHVRRVQLRPDDVGEVILRELFELFRVPEGRDSDFCFKIANIPGQFGVKTW